MKNTDEESIILKVHEIFQLNSDLTGIHFSYFFEYWWWEEGFGF